MKATFLFLGFSTCSPITAKWHPGSGGGLDSGTVDTGGTACDTGADDCANMELEDVPYSFEGSIPGTSDLEYGDQCGGTCYRCLYFDSTDSTVTIYFRVNDAENQWTSTSFFYMEAEPGSYLIQPNTTWTAVESHGMFSDQLGYIVIEPITGAVSVVGLSVCPELEGDVELGEG